MVYLLNEQQILLKESADSFVKNEHILKEQRELLLNPEQNGAKHWNNFSKLGWLGLNIKATYNGHGGSLLDHAILMESFGRGLLLGPYLSSAIMSAKVIELGATEAQKHFYLPAMIDGNLLISFAYAEPTSRYNLAYSSLHAIKKGDKFTLNGNKSMVFFASYANKIIVAARTSGADDSEYGITLFIVDPTAPGVKLRNYPTVDGSSASEVSLSDVILKKSDIIGSPDCAFDLINTVINYSIIAICAEAVGIMETLVTMTQSYIKQRKQFGGPISKFQIIQHQLVDMYIELELSRSLVYRAASIGVENGNSSDSRATSAAKAQIGKAGKLIGQSAVQLHGGMGMTDELEIGQYFKRLTMIDTLFGNTAHHKQRFTALSN